MKVCIVGVVRDVADTVESDLGRLGQSLASFDEVCWLLIESDSQDGTLDCLAELSSTTPNLRYISLGKLEQDIPERISRITFCRNAYLDELESNPIYRDCDYIIVSDFDGTNSLLTKESIDSIWESPLDWSVCTANQRGPYYDVYALRHPIWSPNDCWEAQQYLGDRGMTRDESFFAAVLSRMVTIPEDSDWIEVDSAFGGLAVYKPQSIHGVRYDCISKTGRIVCEHVLFHETIRSKGFNIFINPKLINTDYTNHSRIYQDWKDERDRKEELL